LSYWFIYTHTFSLYCPPSCIYPRSQKPIFWLSFTDTSHHTRFIHHQSSLRSVPIPKMNPSFGLNPPGYVAKKNRTMLKPESTTTTTATSNDPIETYINEIKNHITHYGNVNHRDANGESLMDRYCKIINNVPIEVFQFLVKNGFDFTMMKTRSKMINLRFILHY